MQSTVPGEGVLMDQMVREIRSRASDEGIVFVAGNFNVLHTGHLRLLRFASGLGGRLVVGVSPDGADGVTVPQANRVRDVKAIRAVREVVALDEPVVSFISRLRPEIVVKGREYRDVFNSEQEAVSAYGGRLVFSSGEARLYSSELMSPDMGRLPGSEIFKPLDFVERNRFRITDLVGIIEAFRDLNVVTIGDLIVDEYINCDPLGMSREDPTLVVTPVESRRFVGGAGVVAAHAKALGATVTFVSVSGKDEAAQFAKDQLSAAGVQLSLLTDPTRPTTLKQRYRASGKTLLRVNLLRQGSIDPDLQARLNKAAGAALQTADLLLFSDFNYGCLPQSVVEHLSARARELDVLMAADSQASSQMSDISRFRGMSLITPTEHEARLAMRDEEAGLIMIAERLQHASGAENVVVTLGGEGVLIFAPKGRAHHTDRLPAFNRSPRDVAGAGDSFFTCTAMALRVGADIWQASYLGSLAAAWQVSHVGNTPMLAAELIREVSLPTVRMNELRP
ncbi:PfkB family carbohydrate kinase [Phenylobacterium sp.]|uniref:PfkB family carbohydrate kinase n=1 Tax=Phenylobacterium sp. TaxID=1871053 RepID=UPI0025DADBBF|nr:PfkB family carbohydrate kinase [Phenylobacterium sp.]